MDAVHWHLMLTHIPIVGMLIAAPWLAFGLIFKKQAVVQTALGTLVVLALVAVPVYLTGEGAEEVAENLPGVTESVIEAHEDLAGVSIWLTGATGLLALIGLILPALAPGAGRFLRWIVLVVSLITFGVLAKTGNLGGQIRHTEIRKAVTGQPAALPVDSGKTRHDDDDDDD